MDQHNNNISQPISQQTDAIPSIKAQQSKTKKHINFSIKTCIKLLFLVEQVVSINRF